MGIMRAVAFSRQQLVMTFAYEGFVYSAVASVIGAIIGAALGALIVTGLSEIIAQDQSSSLEGLSLTIKPSTLLVSGAAGLGGVGVDDRAHDHHDHDDQPGGQ